MSAISDQYEIYYSDKLWNLIPTVYREEDGVDPDNPSAKGPLRELVERIGEQAAILRRSIDRLWEDQSIETCDDWVIPYIGDLLATNLVASNDPRARRLDVANTIRYRRRAGTMGILEQIAHDVTGWDARVVEFFRRLARTRHGLDPALDSPILLQQAEGLTGVLTGTAIGGFADLRKVYGAIQTQAACDLTSIPVSDRPAAFTSMQSGAFDEYFHTADFRAGRGSTGWECIPGLGVFLWRLYSYRVVRATPVLCKNENNLYTFDPTGRRIPLFARAARNAQDRYGENWVSRAEWQMPTPIRRPLYDLRESSLYGDVDPAAVASASGAEPSLAVYHYTGVRYELIDTATVGAKVTVHPEYGTFAVPPVVQGDPLAAGYHYGFPSSIGAGTYDRRIAGQSQSNPGPTVSAQNGALPALPASGTLMFLDSLTYGPPTDIAAIADLAITSRNTERPLVQQHARASWTLSGGTPTSTLRVDGIFQSGGDIVLQGSYATVSITCSSLDPGTTGLGQLFDQSVSGLDLKPSRLWIEGDINELIVDRSILGPIRIRGGGSIEQLTISDSIVQGIPTEDLRDFVELKDSARLARRLKNGNDPLSAFLWQELSAEAQQVIADFLAGGNNAPSIEHLGTTMANELNRIDSAGQTIYDKTRFAGVTIDAKTVDAALSLPAGNALTENNRKLLELAYPTELADLALSVTTGVVHLERCTVLGKTYARALEASECIFDDVAQVEDVQAGCVRFSAWSLGSDLPKQYESVTVAPHAPIFTSRDFGNPAYGQLLTDADRSVLPGVGRLSITEGGPTGSEMGALARELGSIKRRSLLIKYREFMPLGLSPVIVNVT